MENTGTTKDASWRAVNGLCIKVSFEGGSPRRVAIAGPNTDGIAFLAYDILLQAAKMAVQAAVESERWYHRPVVCADHGPHDAVTPCPGCAALETEDDDVE